MTDKARSKLEEALEYLINEDEDKAVEAFHNFIVAKARSIHESLLEDDEVEEDLEENEIEEGDDDVNESFDNAVHSDEHFDENELGEGGAGDDDVDADMTDADAEMDLDSGDSEEVVDGGEEFDGEGEEVVVDADDLLDVQAQFDQLSAKFAELLGGEEGTEDEVEVGADVEDEMGELDVDGGDEFAADDEVPTEEGFGLGESTDPTNEEEDEDLEEAVTHDGGVADGSRAKTDPHGCHGDKDSVKHNTDARLPESAEFDFDLTEEDFLDLEEGLKQVDVKMGGEQGGVKFAGEETNTKSPVAQRDKNDIHASPKTLPSTQKQHGGYGREGAPASGKFPHSEDNSHDSIKSNNKDVAKGGGLEKQKGVGAGEVGSGKFAPTETQVKSPIGSKGTRNES